MGNNLFKSLIMDYPEDKIIDFLNRFSEDLTEENQNISLDSNLSDLGLDSLAIISTIALVDEFFDTVITMDQLSSCTKVKDIINLTK